MRAFLREILTILAIAIVVFLGLQFIVQTYVVIEYSMEPTFNQGQRVLVSKIVYKFHEPERGDVIVFHPPLPYDPEGTPFIKRIIALPGESVEIKNGAVYINGSKLQELYLQRSPNYTYSLHKVPEGSYFVLGDNRNNSNDSHTGWTLPRQNIIGKAWLSIWPPSKWGVASNYSLQEQPAGSVSHSLSLSGVGLEIIALDRLSPPVR